MKVGIVCVSFFVLFALNEAAETPTCAGLTAFVDLEPLTVKQLEGEQKLFDVNDCKHRFTLKVKGDTLTDMDLNKFTLKQDGSNKKIVVAENKGQATMYFGRMGDKTYMCHATDPVISVHLVSAQKPKCDEFKKEINHIVEKVQRHWEL